MKVISKIALQIDDYRKISSVNVMQCDSNTRVLEIHLYSSGIEWPVPDGVEVSVAYRKADHTSGWYDKLPNGDAACSVAGNVVTAILAPQVLTAAGRCHVVIVLQDPDTLDQLATFPVRIEVAPNPAAGKGISNDYYNYSSMADVNQAIEGFLGEVGSHHKYRGNVLELGYSTFADCKQPGCYAYSAENIQSITDAPEGLSSGGIVIVEPNAASGVIFQTIKTANKQVWFRYGMNPFTKTVSGLDADRQLCYWGKVLWQGDTFAACTKSGYYNFQFVDIEKITDAPVGLISGGILEVRDNAANGTVFQTIYCANGEEWFRYGENDFIKICRDQSQIDNLYAALGIVNPGSLIQGAPTPTGALNKNTKLSICAPKPMYFGAGVSYNVLLDDGWCFTVTEFDDAECSNAGATYYNKSNSAVYVPRKDYCWVRFNRIGDDGEYAEITPADFDASVVFQRSDRAGGGGGGSDIRSDTPENIGVRNALLNAKQCSQIRYTPVAALPTQKYEDGFPAGSEVQGLPYSSTRIEQLYVPNNVSFYTFMSALQNPNSLLYTAKLDEDYGVDNARTYYGIVCSILTEYALGIKPGYTTAMWDKIPGMELIADQSAYGLRLCDVIWRSGHCLLVTDIKRTGDGTIHSIEVTEATAGRDGTVDVISYALAEFDAKFVHGDTEYKFYRYRHIGRVEHIPSAIVPVGGEVATEVTYNSNLMGRLGDRFNIRSGEDVVLDVLDQATYTQYKVTKDGAALSTAAIPGDGVITLSGLAYGKYSVCLTDGTTDSASIDFIVVDAAAPEVTATSNSNEYKVAFASANATPAWIMWFVDNSRKAVVTQIDELTGNETSITTVLEKTSGYVRVALETEYGIILSESAVSEYSGAPVEDTEDEEHNPENSTSGENGGYYTPTVTQTEAGKATFSWNASREGMPTVAEKEVTLPAGVSPTFAVADIDGGHRITITDANGTRSLDVLDGDDAITPHIGDNGNWYIGTTDTGVQAAGEDGDDGIGIDSVEQTVTAQEDGGSNEITITLNDGSKATFTVKNGSKGNTGDVGPQGPQGEKGDTGLQGPQGEKGDTGAQGKAGAQGLQGVAGYTPVKGTDYWTEADKAEIVAAVIDMLGGNPVFGYVDSNNNIIVSGNLADGSYTVKYEMEDGSMVDIGDLVLDNTVYYAVTNSLTNCVSSNSDTQTAEGDSYYATISANSGYELSSVTVNMGGADISASAVSGGNIAIASVTGNIVITAVAEEVQVAEPVTVDIALTDGIRIGSDGGDRTLVGYCATEMIDLRSIPKPCTINLTKAQWCSDGTSSTVRYYVANASGTALANGVTPVGATDYFTVVDNSGGGYNDVTVTVTSADVGYIRFSGYWAKTTYSDDGSNFANANTKATLTYTPGA